MAKRHFDTFLGASAKSLGKQMGAVLLVLVIAACGFPKALSERGEKAWNGIAQMAGKLR